MNAEEPWENPALGACAQAHKTAEQEQKATRFRLCKICRPLCRVSVPLREAGDTKLVQAETKKEKLERSP